MFERAGRFRVLRCGGSDGEQQGKELHSIHFSVDASGGRFPNELGRPLPGRVRCGKIRT
jgi:hypothetical protein